jgi:hypothetical protein
MKKQPDPTPQTDTQPAPTPPTDTPPAFDQGTAVWQEPPYRHEPSARTVAWHQPLPGGRTALYTATGQLIAVCDGNPHPDPLPAGEGEPSENTPLNS